MIYELRPDLFPEGWLTECEIVLWSRYFDDQKARK
jgi:hypothetical protein